ncbi:hypothetical protein CAPTEDRAFT_221620 [Capitella teleta]|uniref:SUEL-type lectin domain-containing protein n=1 Tax=Capitella teleta TaxID=283909 RepID=R7TJ62_CAPTE|nr:hypothetical protein CAPTEDRAFT_221620 [Capitella teleta]|eukprot:ELT93833.1 hypothetical protein CAPTEDRAFT_221620 [Capitella teleta]
MDYSYYGLWILCTSLWHLPQCISSFVNTKTVADETCILDTFSPRCPSSQRLFITSSHYGHMKLGKCVTVNTGHLGCMSDVTDIVRGRCNGKTRCQIAGSDDEVVRTQPCAQKIYTYLNTSYVCLPEEAQLESCSNFAAGRHWKYLVSTTIDQRCLHQSQSLEVTVQSSMDIEIIATMINDITTDVESVQVGISDIHGNSTVMDILGSSSHSVQQTFESSAVHIMFQHSKAILLFAFRAVGCEDLVAPEFTWIERKRRVITIGCIHNKYTWQVECIGSKWIGFRGNCTRQIELKPVEETINKEEANTEPKQPIFTKGIQYALTIGITVLLCVVVITTGFVCLRKAEYKAKASKDIKLQEMTGDYNTWKATLMRPVTNDLNNPNASPCSV